MTATLRTILAALSRQPAGRPKPMPEQPATPPTPVTPLPAYATHIVGAARWTPPPACGHPASPVFGDCDCRTH